MRLSPTELARIVEAIERCDRGMTEPIEPVSCADLIAQRIELLDRRRG